MPEFVIRRPEQTPPETPEALFRELRPRDPSIRDLYLRQGELLRKYTDEAGDIQDVALELQTGAGKTLVGFLIAEFRRRKFGHRVAYLCPNVQLARQAAAKAHSYGLDVVTLVRAQKEWDPGEFHRFNRAEAVGVATYHQIFNTNPRMDSAQTLVLDDAHSGEDPVASMWSLVIDRSHPAYQGLIAVFADALPETFVERLYDASADPRNRWDVELVSPSVVSSRKRTIIEVLDASILEERDRGFFRYHAISGHIARCLSLVSWNEILMRPLIPPTMLWPPFSGATQRIYMSATVGNEGELERAFGVPTIKHLSVSTPSEDLRFGRRFFLFPDAAYDTREADDFTIAGVELAGRALILTPSGAESDRVRDHALPGGYTVLGASEVEYDFKAFTAQERAAVILANRYDGMDLPDDACRLIVIAGTPAQTHLLERFFLQRLNARRLLSERIRTRFVQGAGRCTRNSRDFAAVVVRGLGLTHFWEKNEEVKACRPDLQAEIEFGFDNASQSKSDLLQLLSTFLSQGDSWQVADTAIRSMAAEATVATPADGEALRIAAIHEVEAWNAIWRDDINAAIAATEGVLDALEGGQDLRPYRALWLYLGASWAGEVASQTGSPSDRQRADSFRSAARQCAGPLPWTPSFGDPKAPPVGFEYDEAGDRALRQLSHLGLRGMGFERRAASAKADLESLEAGRFARAVAMLGELLGFESAVPEGSGAPDVAWRLGDKVIIAFEAKTEEAPDKALTLDAVRQVGTHLAWLRDHLNWPSAGLELAVIIGRHERVGDGVTRSVAGTALLVTPDELIRLFMEAIDVHRRVRAQARGLSDEQLRALLSQELNHAGLAGGSIGDRLSRHSVSEMCSSLV